MQATQSANNIEWSFTLFFFICRCELCLISYTQFKHILYSRQHPYNANNTSCTLSAIKIRNINKVTGVVPACQTNTNANTKTKSTILWLVYLLIYMYAKLDQNSYALRRPHSIQGNLFVLLWKMCTIIVTCVCGSRECIYVCYSHFHCGRQIKAPRLPHKGIKYQAPPFLLHIDYRSDMHLCVLQNDQKWMSRF